MSLYHTPRSLSVFSDRDVFSRSFFKAENLSSRSPETSRTFTIVLSKQQGTPLNFTVTEAEIPPHARTTGDKKPLYALA